MKVLFKNNEDAKRFIAFLDERAAKNYLSSTQKIRCHACYELYKVNEFHLVEFDIIDTNGNEDIVAAHQKVQKAICDCNGLEFEFITHKL